MAATGSVVSLNFNFFIVLFCCFDLNDLNRCFSKVVIHPLSLVSSLSTLYVPNIGHRISLKSGGEFKITLQGRYSQDAFPCLKMEQARSDIPCGCWT